MAPLTWRNVDAPNFSAAIDGIRASGSLFGNASDAMTKALDSYQEGKTQEASSRYMQDVMRNGDADALRNALASGTVGAGLNPRYLDPKALGFTADWMSSLDKLALANRELGLRGQGKGGGRGGKDDIVDTMGQRIGGHYDENNNIVSTPTVKEVLPLIDAAPAATNPKVSALEGDLVGDVVAAASPSLAPGQQSDSIMYRDLPSSESAFGAPRMTVSEMEAAAEAAGDAPAANDPVSRAIALMPTPGPIRLGRPKGKDGGAQINREMFRDAVRGRGHTFLNADASDEIEALFNNLRFTDNLSVTDGLKAVEKAVETAKAGQDFQLKGHEIREKDRGEEKTLRSDDWDEQARLITNQLIAESGSPERAKAYLQNYTSGENALPPEVISRVQDKLNNSGELFKNFVYPEFDQSVTTGAALPASTVAPVIAALVGTEGSAAASDPAKVLTDSVRPQTEPAQPKSILEMTPTGIRDDPLTRAATLAQDSLRQDASHNDNEAFLTQYLGAEGVKSSPAELWVKAKDSGKYEGWSRADYLNALNEVQNRIKTDPGQAAVLLDFALADSVWYKPQTWGGVDGINDARLDELTRLIVNPVTKEPSSSLTKLISATRDQQQEAADIGAAQQNYATAMQELRRVQGLKAKGAGRENLDISLEEDRAKRAGEVLQLYIDRAANPAGPANTFTNRNRERRETVAKGEAPEGDQTPTHAEEQQAVFETLVSELDHEPTQAEIYQLRETAKNMVSKRRHNKNVSSLIDSILGRK